MGVLLRLLFLDADPKHYAWIGYLTDEGRWTHQAREVALFGSLDFSGWLATVHLVAAPLFQAATWVSFTIFGVGFTSARLVSAVSGCLLLVAVLVFARRRMSPEAVLLTVIALALQRDVIFLSRVAIPEMPLMLFEFLAFAVLVAEPRSTKRAFAAGILLAIGLGFKATGFPMFPILLGVALIARRSSDPSGPWARAAAICAAVLGAAAIVIGVALLVTDISTTSRLDNLSGLVGSASPYAAASYFLYESFAPDVNYLLIGTCLSVGLLVALGRLPQSRARTTYVGSIVWTAGWIAIPIFSSYFPERYYFHVFVPLALSLGAGLTLLQAAGAAEIRRSLREVRGPRRLIAAAVLSIPVAVFLAPLFVALGDGTGLGLDRLQNQLLLLIGLDVTLALATYSAMKAEGLLYFLVIPALVIAPLRVTALEIGLMGDDFWNASRTSIASWTILWALTAAATGILRARWRAARVPALVTPGYLAVTATLMLCLALPPVFERTYTIRDTARYLENHLSPDDTVWTQRSAGIVFGTRLRYREALSTEDPPMIVSMHGPTTPPALPGTYEVVEERQIEVGVDQAYLDRHGIDRTFRIMNRVSEPTPEE